MYSDYRMMLFIRKLRNPPARQSRLIQLLNMGTTKRLERIVETCHRLDQIGESIAASGDSKDSAREKEFSRLLKELNQHLSGFRWHPVLAGYFDRGFYFHTRFSFHAATHQERVENQAVEWLIRHIKDVNRIRLCKREACGKWFWASRQDQKYCSDNCRNLDHQKGADFKRKRAEYMKQYRQDQKILDNLAKQLLKEK